MASDLQRLVDHLGNRLGRSVAIDDPHIRLLAYNAHTTDVDEVRVGSIMRRSVPAELTGHLHDLGVHKAEDIFTVPARPDIGLTVERTGMPVRYEQILLGYLWLVGSDGPVTAEHADALREAAGHAALIMHREHLADELARGRERELLRDLLADDPALHADAAEELLDQELAVAGAVTALVATVSQPAGEPLGEQDRLALGAAVDHGRRRLPPRTALTLLRPGHALLVAISPPHGGTGTTADELAAAVHERLVTESGRDNGECWIGIGSTQRNLRDLRRGYHEAWRAADVARITGALGPVAHYSGLGVYALLSQLSPQQLADALHPGVRSLLDNGNGHDELVATLAAYLDNAGDAKRTVTALHVHRATLYYRLRRIEELSGLDLSRGDDRLAAHLSLKLARLLE
ncbi:PucR family transcriptional regulator [Amycolatopsis suaedae]|uniref:CdaR family transcriptional regulator n=1 Tax=Amycolatopsis suaedae TaxID=2510978 RepID=A0A4Q7JDJ4_9PSEU|nr:helix-turn-helix domain-containing protein [Amycolatopsis suaedae]RZQ65970.1 CdaR family transcriptional regulator [Amycolatopsis suaedae]